ncbi:guanylate kinase [Prochlorococcus marinus]|uniref:Guanylate kinase n=1 Tax=Prochlorococcus marinus XMU1408 TaxID=2213228 RepID=A0A318R4Q5_PROMR|nr:guanylate kinase [Prochlorococcus marinus]MBW3041494.1 guanylate kinase [Prochlorococcus marinus str. XMU1408]PYE02652.1 guanylate kinase [Prochlorococcus marinus XMU1408]
MSSLGNLTVLTGPSGVGKGTIVRKILDKHSDVWLSISATTRHPRAGEIDGQHYFFLEQKEFQKIIDSGGFLEWASFSNNCYGTPQKIVKEKIEKGTNVLLEIELEGARQIRNSFPEALQIFLAPPNLSELEKRIRGRGTETESSIKDRLAIAKKEIIAKKEFDAVVINDDIDKAFREIEGLMGLKSS